MCLIGKTLCLVCLKFLIDLIRFFVWNHKDENFFSFGFLRCMSLYVILMNKSANFFIVLYTDEMVYSFAMSLLLLGCSF